MTVGTGVLLINVYPRQSGHYFHVIELPETLPTDGLTAEFLCLTRPSVDGSTELVPKI